MIIKEVLEQLEIAAHPVAKALHKGIHCKVLAMAFKKGMTLKDHAAHQETTLVVITGKVVYKEGTHILELGPYDQTGIPVNIVHSVEAMEDSLCLLTQG